MSPPAVSAEPSPADRARVAELLGREPQGRYTIAARDDAGDPAVIQNAPFLDDGTPMPTHVLADRARVRSAASGSSRPRAASTPPRPTSTPTSSPPPTPATPPLRDAMIPDRSHRAATVAAASAAPGSASSACTPTGPGTSPAATIRSGDGSPSELDDRCRVIAFDGVHVDIGDDATRVTLADRHPARHCPWGSPTLTEAWLAEHDPAASGEPHQRARRDRRPSRRRRPRAPDVRRVVRGEAASFAGDDDHVAGAPRARSRRRAGAPLPSIAPAAEDVFRLVATEPQPTAPTILDYRRSMSTRSSPRAAWCWR